MDEIINVYTLLKYEGAAVFKYVSLGSSMLWPWSFASMCVSFAHSGLNELYLSVQSKFVEYCTIVEKMQFRVLYVNYV